jgi:guanylate kinase
MARRNRGVLFVISGPSGAGKGTLRKVLFDRVPGLAYSVSCTTRHPREGERDGIDYWFVTEEIFDRTRDRGEFLEWAFVHDHHYGTRAEDVRRELERGRDVVLEIDVQGALSVRDACPDAVLIFIAPPSVDELSDRLRERGTETSEDLSLRLRNAMTEMEMASKYDHVILNDNVERAAEELIALVESYRNPKEVQS